MVQNNVVVEAKQEYTKQLISILQPVIYEALFVLYTNCEEEPNVLHAFKNELKEIPKWNNEIIKAETTRILNVCSFFNDLLTAVILSNVRILTSIRLKSSKQKVKITIPTNESFTHTVYTKVSELLQNDIQLFDEQMYNGDVVNNMKDVYALIEVACEGAIRKLLPVESILTSSLSNNREVLEEGSDEEDEPQPDEEEEPAEEEPMDEEPPDLDVPQARPEPANAMDRLMEPPAAPDEFKEVNVGGSDVPPVEKPAPAFFSDAQDE